MPSLSRDRACGGGSVIDCSNADVAALLGSKAIIVSGGGVGRAIDEIMLNKALFDICKVPVLGVIINKVLPDKLEKIKSIVGKGLDRKGIRLLGVIPEMDLLSAPTVEQIRERLDLKVFSGEENLRTRVYDAIVAAMEPYNMIGHLRDGALVITSGDRWITCWWPCLRICCSREGGQGGGPHIDRRIDA